MVLTCTSGTAAANFAPAVHEAREAGVPLVVLTADRPPELREVGAGQVIDQVKLYGNAAKWSFEVDAEIATADRVRFMRALACRAVMTAAGDRPGVVHLNFPLRDPLIPPAGLPEPLPRGRPDGRPWITGETPGGAVAPATIGTARRVVVVAGTGAGPPAAQLAARGGFPLLADPLSGARRGAAAIAHYDHLLRDDAFVAGHRPDVVVRVGDVPTSKPLRAWLASLDEATQVLVRGPAVWNDPMAAGTIALDAPVGALRVDGEPSDPAWLEAWKAADARAATAIEAVLGDGLSEPRVVRDLGARLGADATVWVASSMPVRDVEAFFGVRDDGPRVLANRGANGIDGTVSSAFGAAAAGERVVLLIGDVALLHDVGGLLAARRHGLAVTIVLLDNDGGGIFEFLAVRDEGDAYVEHVATPHGADFAGAAQLFGVDHVRPATLAAFRDALDTALAGDRTTLIEVRSDRAENRALHARVADAVRAATRG